MLTKLLNFLRPNPAKARKAQTVANVDIPHERISRLALQVIQTLQQAGYQAYLVGGGVRDLLVGLTPKDFDIATNATPEQAKPLFRHARIIGRRFKLLHVQGGREIIEVATFRSHHDNSDDSNEAHTHATGRILRDNVYGTQADDAERRDFTINALYYDPISRTLLDATHGLADIRAKRLRLLGNPHKRYLEDPVRMLRAVRFAAKLDFTLDPATEAPIAQLATHLRDVPSARLFDEVLKLFQGGQALATFHLLEHLHLFAQLFPDTAHILANGSDLCARPLLEQALANTDQRIQQGKPVNPAFLFAALLWPALRQRCQGHEGAAALTAQQDAAQVVLQRQCQRTAIPKRFTLMMREIWELQLRLERRQGKRAELLFSQPRFRAGYDFLLLRETAGEVSGELGVWWTHYQTLDEAGREALVRRLGQSGQARRTRRPRKRAHPSNHD